MLIKKAGAAPPFFHYNLLILLSNLSNLYRVTLLISHFGGCDRRLHAVTRKFALDLLKSHDKIHFTLNSLRYQVNNAK